MGAILRGLCRLLASFLLWRGGLVFSRGGGLGGDLGFVAFFWLLLGIVWGNGCGSVV